jgi:hypothetical protein
MFSPFSYSADKEKVGGFNDEEHFLINNKHKVNVSEYFDFALNSNKPDIVVSPLE